MKWPHLPELATSYFSGRYVFKYAYKIIGYDVNLCMYNEYSSFTRNRLLVTIVMNAADFRKKRQK